jgi:hypothetical protein
VSGYKVTAADIEAGGDGAQYGVAMVRKTASRFVGQHRWGVWIKGRPATCARTAERAAFYVNKFNRAAKASK